MMQFTGQIQVSDDAMGYRATLQGDWTAEQIRAAFADGYDWAGSTDSIHIDIESAAGDDGYPAQAARLRMAPGEEYGDYPHHIDWRTR